MPNWITAPPRVGAHSGTIRLTLPVTPPASMGTTIGAHIWIEDPDQSSTPAADMSGTTLMDGTATLQGPWNPIDGGMKTYIASQQPWIVEFGSGINRRTPHDVRVYVASYSDTIDTPLVRYGLGGATPSYVVTIPAEAVAGNKPQSGSNITPFLVTGITGSVSAAVSISAKLRRPIGITVDLSGLPPLSNRWAYQLQGYVDGDITQSPVLMSGIITDTTGGLIPAGPDGITVPHTFGPEEPTSITSITVYAVAGTIAPDRYVPGSPARSPGAFTANNIVPGITASCVISIGTTGGVIDAAALQGLTVTTALIADLAVSSAKIADGAVLTAKIPDLGIITSKLAANAVDSTKLAALAVLSGNLADSAVTATKIANLAVGTAAIALLAVGNAQIADLGVTNAKIGNLAVDTGQIQALAVTTAKIGLLQVTNAQIKDATIASAKIVDLDVTKLNAGTIAVAVTLTAPTLVVTSGVVTINIDAANYIKVASSATGVTAAHTAQNFRLDGPSGRFATVTLALMAVHDGSANEVDVSATGISFSVSGGAFNQVIGPRLPGPGNPVFTTLGDAQSWCQSLLNQLRNHGLVT